MALVTLRDITVGFGGPPLLDGVSMQIEPREKVCLVGRNGAGKTTLLRLIGGKLKPDRGEVETARGARVATLDQEVPMDMTGTCAEVVASGLARTGEDDDGHLAQAVISRLGLDGEARLEEMSGGMKRRVMLARALASQPDLLLLDEPTNHLDIDSIRWLEDFLSRYDKAVLFVSHDRVFVQKLATRIADLERGRLVSYPGDFGRYRELKDRDLATEERQDASFDRKLAQEEVWIRKGVRERRTRNEGRVRALKALREMAGQRRQRAGSVKITMQGAARSAKKVVVTDGASYSFDGARKVVDGLSTTIFRGDRVGIMGPNGCGKTTLLRMLLGDIEPVEGMVTRGDNLEVAYLDQLRGQLDENKTVLENVVDKGDKVIVNGTAVHIVTYLKNFLFSAQRARTPVWVLSGGERNRLLLAKLFTRPSNVLVLDEPTNDLDAETLELLEESVLEYEGTVLFVSHDRAFINNVATNTLVFEGDGKISEFVGGYDDWISQGAETKAGEGGDQPGGEEKRKPRRSKQIVGPRKLTYAERIELDGLPAKIEELEGELARIHAAMADPDSYKDGGADIPALQEEMTRLDETLAATYERWEELEGIREAHENG